MIDTENCDMRIEKFKTVDTNREGQYCLRVEPKSLCILVTSDQEIIGGMNEPVTGATGVLCQGYDTEIRSALQDQMLPVADGFFEEDKVEDKEKEGAHLSSLPQSIFNCTNSLLGVGLLSLPYTMRVCGWLGIGVLFLFAAITHHTATLLGRIMDYRPERKLRNGPGAYTMNGFQDMGYAAFGQVACLIYSAHSSSAPAIVT